MTGDTTLDGDLVVSGAGPHAFGAGVADYIRTYIAGNYTSGGSSTVLYGLLHAGALTGHSGDSAGISGMRLDTTTVTAGNATLVSQLNVNEPQITVGSGTVTNSASVYVAGAATEATNNFALWVDAGATQLDGTLDVAGVTTLDSTVNITAGPADPNPILHVTRNSAVDSRAVLELDRNVATNGKAFGILFTGGTSTSVTAGQIYGEILVSQVDVTNGSVDGSMLFATAKDDTVATKMALTNDGHLGIGTTAPTSPASINKILEISDGTSAGLVLHDTTAEAWDIYADGTDLSIGYNDAVNIHIEGDTGSVAIGAPGAGSGDLYGAALTVNKDADNKCYFGKSFMSSTGSGMTADRAHWGHVDHEVGTRYAIMQHSNGDTNLNATTGQAIYFNIAASSKMTMTATGLSIVGSLSKGSGSFNIRHPHPSKEDTHRLVHSFVESPGADLIYRSTVTLVDGQATVDLDEAAGMTSGTWVLLCRDEQVYTSNETGWHHVRGSVSGSTLTIDCEEECDDTVSWMVVASRKDQHMYDTEWTDEDGYPIIEPLKPADRGYDNEEDSPSASISPSASPSE